MGSMRSRYRKMTTWLREVNKEVKGRDNAGELGRGRLIRTSKTYLQAGCCVDNGLQGERMAVRRPARRQVRKWVAT